MTHPLSVVGFFCEDIRDEQTGGETLIGVFPDNMVVPGVPGALPRAAVYVRINFDPTTPPAGGHIVMRWHDGTETVIGDITEALITQSRDGVVSSGLPIVGIKSKTILSPFVVPSAGRIDLVAKFGDAEHLCAILNVKVAEPGQEATSNET